MEDRNIETKERYKNIFELRQVKNKFLIETMPTLVKNYCLINYSDLLNKFNITMNGLTKYLTPKTEIPQNIYYYKNIKHIKYIKKERNDIDINILYEKANLYYEYKLFKSLKG